MRIEHMRGVSRRRSFCVTTERDVRHRPAPDLVNRAFVATDINQLWVADMTYIPTWSGFLYLAMVIDVYSRRVVGWAFGERMTAELVIEALNMALMTRKPESVIHHSDQGSQYTASRLATAAAKWGCVPRWEPLAMRMTMRWQRAFLPAWNVSSSRGVAGRPRPRHAWRCLPGSRVGITHAGGIQDCITCPPITFERKHQQLSTHTKNQLVHELL